MIEANRSKWHFIKQVTKKKSKNHLIRREELWNSLNRVKPTRNTDSSGLYDLAIFIGGLVTFFSAKKKKDLIDSMFFSTLNEEWWNIKKIIFFLWE